MTRAGLFMVFSLSCLLATVVTTTAQEARPPAVYGDYNQPPPEPLPDPAIARLRDSINPEFDPWTPAYVIERCAEHLSTINEKDRCRIRYLVMAPIPRYLLPGGIATLNFGTNSTAFVTQTYTPRPVPNADNRIFWFDLAWFNWSAETWENISQEDPYYREPIIPSDSRGLIYLKEWTKANAVIRGDWFMWYAFDNGEFINVDGAEIFNEKSFYYQLVYSNVAFVREVNENGKKVKKVVKGVGPANTKELEQAWGVNFELLKQFPLDKGFFVDEGFSGVAFQNRIAWRVDNGNVKYYRTFDVFRTAGDQDFFETPFPLKFDAGEHIIQMSVRGAQFYHLSDGKGASVDFANPFVVKGDQFGPHHTVLVTSKSCIHCHVDGIIDYRNEHLINTKAGVDLLALTPDRAERFRQFYLQEAKMQKMVRRDQEDYADFIRDCNGLSPQENMTQFNRFRRWYISPVTLPQAAREIGCTEKILADALGNLATKGRLGRLALDGYPIPRHAWERGLYAEAALLVAKWQTGR